MHNLSPGCPQYTSFRVEGVSSCRSRVFLGMQPHSTFLCRIFSNRLLWDYNSCLSKSFTQVLAVVLVSLDTSLISFLSRVFEIIPFIPQPGLFCTVWLNLNFLMILLSLRFLTFWNDVITLHIHLLLREHQQLFFLKSKLICFRHDAFSSDSSSFLLCVNWKITPSFSFNLILCAKTNKLCFVLKKKYSVLC